MSSTEVAVAHRYTLGTVPAHLHQAESNIVAVRGRHRFQVSRPTQSRRTGSPLGSVLVAISRARTLQQGTC